jgi:nucleoid DNA-binding protein
MGTAEPISSAKPTLNGRRQTRISPPKAKKSLFYSFFGCRRSFYPLYISPNRNPVDFRTVNTGFFGNIFPFEKACELPNTEFTLHHKRGKRVLSPPLAKPISSIQQKDTHMAARKTAAKKKSPAKKKAPAKKAAKKAVVKKAAPAKAPKSIKERYSKTQLLNHLAESTELSRKQVSSVLDELSSVIEAHISKRGAGEFVMPGLFKVITVKKPARKARKGVNPFTGEETVFKAKPASIQIKVRPLKKMKEMAE